MPRNEKQKQKLWIISRVVLFAAIASYGLAIYSSNGNLQKNLVILGLMLFAIFEGITPRPR